MPHSTASSISSISEEPPLKQLLVKAPSSSSSFASSVLQVPDEITLNCLACVPRCYYPTISLVSKTFRRLITSPEIYIERSVSCRTEHVLYVVLRSYATETPRWYSLNLKPFGSESGSTGIGINHRLVPIPSFPPIPCWGMSIIALDSEIYVLGGCINDELVSTVFVIQCPSYTCRYLPRMKQARGCAAVGFVHGKLYVIGGCDPLSLNWVEAFDLKTQTWETVLGIKNVEVHEKTIRSFVMNDKIYIMDRKNSFVYDPIEGRLESDMLLDTQWSVCSCVIDDRLYTFGSKHKIWVFDTISRSWSGLKGLVDVPQKRDGCRMANHGGKLAIFSNRDKGFSNREEGSTEVWCTEIELERRGDKTWGTVLWSNLVITLKDPFTMVQCLAVKI